MKRLLQFTAAILLLCSLSLGVVALYIFVSSRQECSDMVERSAGMERSAVAARGSASEVERRKDADYARSGAMMVCETARDRQQNAWLIGGASMTALLVAAVALLISRRPKPNQTRVLD